MIPVTIAFTARDHFDFAPPMFIDDTPKTIFSVLLVPFITQPTLVDISK